MITHDNVGIRWVKAYIGGNMTKDPPHFLPRKEPFGKFLKARCRGGHPNVSYFNL